jgi:hypothetical protein
MAGSSCSPQKYFVRSAEKRAYDSACEASVYGASCLMSWLITTTPQSRVCDTLTELAHENVEFFLPATNTTTVQPDKQVKH